MSILKRWDGSAWVLVPDGSMVKIWNGSAWVSPASVKYWNGTAWVNAWTQTDPITLTFYATLTTSLRWSGSSNVYDASGSHDDDTKADMHIGRYGGTYPYHYTSMMHFRDPSNEGGGTLDTAMGIRPVVKSASLRLRRVSSGLGSPAGNIRVGTWTQGFLETLPPTDLSGIYHDWDPMTVTSVSGWSIDTTKTIPVDPVNVTDLIFGKSLMLAEVISGYKTSGPTTSAYMKLYGLNDGAPDLALAPLLTVTLDYF